MNRLPIEWLQARDLDDLPDHLDRDSYEQVLEFRLRAEWFGVDDDQLLLPISVLYKEGIDHDGYPAILKQYGGESLLNDMLLDDQELESGSTWVLAGSPDGLRVRGVPEDESD